MVPHGASSQAGREQAAGSVRHAIPLPAQPYIPYADCHPEAVGGFAGDAPEGGLVVECPPELLTRVPESSRAALLGVLAQDPRPSYQDNPGRVYGFGFAGLEVRFAVREGVLTVTDIGPSRL